MNGHKLKAIVELKKRSQPKARKSKAFTFDLNQNRVGSLIFTDLDLQLKDSGSKVVQVYKTKLKYLGLVKLGKTLKGSLLLDALDLGIFGSNLLKVDSA